MLTPSSELRDVNGITNEQKQRIKDFMQGAIYCWVKNRRGEWFAVRDLMGGDNYEWGGTPLEDLYQKHVCLGKSGQDAVEAAAKDLGWLVKIMLATDKRTFEAGKAGGPGGGVNSYRWVGNEP